jgi:hypothetical protein
MRLLDVLLEPIVELELTGSRSCMIARP